MSDPRASRPHMPGYGVEPVVAGAGLLAWEWAEERLQQSHDYWVATVWPDGRPHVMPVWGVFLDGGVWLSSSPRSRKAINLRTTPVATVATSDPRQPVVVEGGAIEIADVEAVRSFAQAMDHKYETDYGVEFYRSNATFAVTPDRVIGLDTERFTSSPTRWTFGRPDSSER